MADMVKFEGVSKSYKSRRSNERRRILTDLELVVASGECVGLLGPNGAGKSTIARLICGLISQDSGVVETFGKPANRLRPHDRRALGVVFGQRHSLWWDLSVRDNLDYAAQLYRVPKTLRAARCGELIDALGLGHVAASPIRSLSLGERVKCELASAVVGQPRLLILDEPTIGVDVSSKVQIRRMINERVLSTGTAVLLTSHDMGDIEGVATRTVLLRDQGVHFSGNLAELRSRLRMRSVIRLQRSERPFDEQAIERIRGAVGSIGLDVNASDRAQLTIEVGESEVVQVLQRIPLDLADSVTIDLPTLEQALASEFAKW